MNCKFNVSKCAQGQTAIDTHPRPRVPRANEIPAKAPRVRQTILKRRPREKEEAAQEQRQKCTKSASPSVLDMLMAQRAVATAVQAACGHLREPQKLVGDTEIYIENLKRDIAAGKVDLRGCPWIRPRNPCQIAHGVNEQRLRDGERPVDPDEALNLVLQPSVFVWAPERLCPGQPMFCPTCKQPTKNCSWGRHRVLHSVQSQSLYITMEYRCYQCPAAPRTSTTLKATLSDQQATLTNGSRREKSFLADAPEVIALLPDHVASMWDLVNTGRIICDRSVADLVRSMATKSSWSAIADTLNEAKATSWLKDVTTCYLQICALHGMQPRNAPARLPDKYRLSADWVRNLFMADWQLRKGEVAQELAKEKGDDVLVLDWTKDAAARCGGSALFNVMDGNRRILLSRLTASCSPYEAQPLILELVQRGVRPKVVYVDDGCCGAWKAFLESVWPGVFVRLDGMHAIMRLTQTVTSTQHPWYGHFCVLLSQAIYTYNQSDMARLRRARARKGLGPDLPKSARSNYVPRVIADAPIIVASIEAAIASFQGRAHSEMGPLLTSETSAAWTQLRKHVQAGCLCDPPGVNLMSFGKSAVIGGEEFRTIQTLRGASALEGFHAQLKQWLGPFAHHGTDAGTALLTDGVLRWNRKRNNEGSGRSAALPLVFANGLLNRVDDLQRRLTGERLYPGLALRCASTTPGPAPAAASSASAPSRAAVSEEGVGSSAGAPLRNSFPQQG